MRLDTHSIRATGLRWYGDIPKYWRFVRIKHIVAARRGAIKTGPFGSHLTSSDMSHKDVKVYNQRTVIDNDFNAGENYISNEKYDLLNAFRVFPADILLTTRGTIGCVAIVPTDAEPGILHPCLMRLQANDNRIDTRYLALLLDGSSKLKEQLNWLSNATTIEVIYSDDLKKLVLPLPPKSTQRAIANFLDRKTAAIDRLIAAKERLIALLAEKRQALITRAVTRGLDPKVPLKDSGIPWLGRIPEHWKIVPLKRKWRVTDCKHKTPRYVTDGYRLVSTTEVKPGRLALTHVRRMVDDADFQDMTDGRLPKRGDIIYSRNASLGAAAFVDTDELFCMGQDVVLITSPDQNQLFLTFQLNSPAVLTQVKIACVGATFKRINVGQIQELAVAVPPVSEQEKIAFALDRSTAASDSAMSAVERQLDRIREYRQTLISAAVTGKIDVRGDGGEEVAV
jgi:type I restriction enzyme, S subunit